MKYGMVTCGKWILKNLKNVFIALVQNKSIQIYIERLVLSAANGGPGSPEACLDVASPKS